LRKIAASALILLMLAVGQVGFSYHNVFPQPLSSQPLWWNTSFMFEQNITVNNPSNLTLLNHPVLVRLYFPASHLVSGVNELRLVNSSGTEIPSTVFGEQVLNDSVTSLWLIFLTSLQPFESQTFQAYYGNPSSLPPSYRSYSPVSKLSTSSLSISLITPQLYSERLDVTFAGTFNQTMDGKVSYSPSSDYGSLDISAAPWVKVAPFSLIGLLSNGSQVATVTYQAGALYLTRVIVSFSDAFFILDLIQNNSTGSVSNVSMTELIDSSDIASLGYSVTNYDVSSSTSYSVAGGAYLGYRANASVQAFSVGNASDVYAEVRNNSLGYGQSYVGTSAAAEQLSLGNIPAGGYATLNEAWSLQASYSSLYDRLGGMLQSLAVTVSPEVALNPYIPQVNLLWRTQTDLTFLAAPTPSFTIPLPNRNLTWVPELLTSSGTLQYAEPSSSFSSASSGDWTAARSASGDTLAYASMTYWSVELSTFVGRLSLWSPTINGSGSAELLSRTAYLFNSSDQTVTIEYKASVLVNAGSLQNQTMYVEVDTDPSLAGNFTNSIVIPLAGTLLPTNSSTYQNLQADDSWHQLQFNLSDLTGGVGQLVRIRAVTSSSNGFSGQLELDLAVARVSGSVPADQALFFSLSPSSPVVLATYKQSSLPLPRSSTLNVSLVFTTVQPLMMQPQTGTSFSGEFSSNPTQANPLLYEIRLTTPFYGLSPVLNLNQTQLPLTLKAPDSLSVESSGLASLGMINGSSTIGVSFSGSNLAFEVTDANGNPLPGALISVTPEGYSSALIVSPTDSLGTSRVTAIPWTYEISVSFSGDEVYSGPIQLTSNSALSIKTQVSTIFLKVLDSQGNPLPGEFVNVTGNNYSESGITNQAGILPLQVVTNQRYAVTVGADGSILLRQLITPVNNNSTIQLQTSFENASFRFQIEAAVVGAVGVVSALLFIALRYPRLLHLRRSEA
jgi:hypothetical protein